MGDWLTLERAINRDAIGNIMPESIEVEGMTNDDGSHPRIKVLPMTRGEFAELSALNETSTGKDVEIIRKHCINPKFSATDFDNMSMRTVNAIVFAIVEASTGMPQSQLKESSLQRIKDAQESILKKKQQK